MKGWSILTLALWIGGCATAGPPANVHQLLDHNRLDRAADAGGPPPRTRALVTICVDPSLEAALMVTSRILSDGHARLVADDHLVALAGRTQANLIAVGADLSRLCAAWTRGIPSARPSVTVSAPAASGAVGLGLLPAR